jgi:UDP-glucose:(galactosyl)LPS alpha-1,2-glucosyltransferase
MNLVPIAFAFDENLIFPSKICISSLLMNAHKDTFYDVFILHDNNCRIDMRDYKLLEDKYTNCRIQCINVGKEFSGGFEIRNITTACYYRLLIPDLIHQYDKVFYADVDIIFRMDLFELYSLDLSNYYLAATLDLGLILDSKNFEYIKTLHLQDSHQYIQSGFLLLNTKKMREDKLLPQFKKLYQKKLKYQDQDMLNIVCRNSIKILPIKYNMTNYTYNTILKRDPFILAKYSSQKLDSALMEGNIHYNGYKPWKQYCANFDIWWEYYRKSCFFEAKYYYDFFNEKAFEYDTMPLIDRLKIIYRYFRYKQYKNVK